MAEIASSRRGLWDHMRRVKGINLFFPPPRRIAAHRRVSFFTPQPRPFSAPLSSYLFPPPRTTPHPIARPSLSPPLSLYLTASAPHAYSSVPATSPPSPSTSPASPSTPPLPTCHPPAVAEPEMFPCGGPQGEIMTRIQGAGLKCLRDFVWMHQNHFFTGQVQLHGY